MPVRYNRRDFLKHLMALSATGVAVSACGAPATPAPTALPPTSAPPTAAPAPTALPPTAAAVPTAAPTLAPTALPTAMPTAAPTATVIARPTAGPAYLAAARGVGADPAELTRRAIAAIGGIEKFVKQGANVIIKPNICLSYNSAEYATTTNPDVVAAIVRLCRGAGAKRVRVMDFPFSGTPQACYENSGIAALVKAAGGEMEVMNSLKYRKIAIPQGRRIKEWEVYGEILDADLVINVPIAKDHTATRLTLGMKNLMGIVRDRNNMHKLGLDQTIADLNSVVRPQLTIIDAIRILVGNGPTGGDLNDVKRTDTIIACADVVAADAYATSLFGMKPADIQYIRLGAEMGLGQMDLKTLKVEEISV